MSSTNTNTSRCDLCEQKINIQNGNYLHSSSCYTWLTTNKDSSKTISDTKELMCSNCNKNPIAEKQLCGFTDWCAYCDTTLWSMRDDDIPDETE